MTWESAKPWLATAVRLVLGVSWIWASLSKIGSPRAFVQTVRAYDATPEWLSTAIGYGLPTLEFLLGALLIVGIVVRATAAISGVLLLIFLIGLVQADARGIHLSCGCFSHGGITDPGDTNYVFGIVAALVLLGCAAYLVVWTFSRISVEEYLTRHDYVEPPSAKRMRSPQGRRKYEAEVERKRSAAASRDRWAGASIAGIVVLVTLIAIGVQSSRAKIHGAAATEFASASHGVTFGKKAAATVDVYEDFACVPCRHFENAVGKTMEADVRANRAQVRYHPVAFIDTYSARAANAALCASDIQPNGDDRYVAFHNILFGSYRGKRVQPSKPTSRTNNDFDEYGVASGIIAENRADFVTCVRGEQHKALVQAITERASAAGIGSLPVVKVNGKTLSSNTLGAYATAVAAAVARGPKPSPSVTPKPTPTPTGTPTTASPTAPSSPTGSTSAKASSSHSSSSHSSSSKPAPKKPAKTPTS